MQTNDQPTAYGAEPPPAYGAPPAYNAAPPVYHAQQVNHAAPIATQVSPYTYGQPSMPANDGPTGVTGVSAYFQQSQPQAQAQAHAPVSIQPALQQTVPSIYQQNAHIHASQHNQTNYLNSQQHVQTNSMQPVGIPMQPAPMQPMPMAQMQVMQPAAQNPDEQMMS